MGSYLHPTQNLRVFAYIARRYNSAAESTSLLSSVASLAKSMVKYEHSWNHTKEVLKSKTTTITMVYFFHAFNDLFKVVRSTFTFTRDLTAYIASTFV